MTDSKNVDELIKMLDASFVSGTGHVNVIVNDDEDITLQVVTVEKGMGCSIGDTACNIPTIEIDDNEI